ncbi:uncharacterized protein [Salvelinus sp. IW2-2015]|uniref:uncharacterized protein n=1 Tax=Salvelinus sp. IW2-2015 TaxID=2691554 RepID=UPI000CDFC236|nr:uncharacterized protein LOC111972104 [Salvelinus alpinus]XP_023854727.1 uncharacterized protein LOC111972104 [Salvelinus alpinus]
MQSQPRAAPVPLYTLHYLPTLSLGVSSSETVLAGLLNSSALTLFSFPTLGSVPGASQGAGPAACPAGGAQAEAGGGCDPDEDGGGGQGCTSCGGSGNYVLPKEGVEREQQARRAQGRDTCVGCTASPCPWRNSGWLIYNYQGVCRFPLTNGNNQVLLLNSQVQRGPGALTFCVPIDNEDLKVVELDQGGTKISIKPNMVAKECGCHCFLHVVQ